MSVARAETVSTTPTFTPAYSRTDVHSREVRTMPLSDTPRGEGGLRVTHSSQVPTHAFAVGSANVVTSVVLCAQGHMGAVSGFMVGSGAASDTGIIERGHT